MPLARFFLHHGIYGTIGVGDQHHFGIMFGGLHHQAHDAVGIDHRAAHGNPIATALIHHDGLKPGRWIFTHHHGGNALGRQGLADVQQTPQALVFQSHFFIAMRQCPILRQFLAQPLVIIRYGNQKKIVLPYIAKNIGDLNDGLLKGCHRAMAIRLMPWAGRGRRLLMESTITLMSISRINSTIIAIFFESMGSEKSPLA